MVSMATQYPVEGTRAAQMLEFIRENPGATANRIRTALGLGNGTADRGIARLIQTKSITYWTDDNGRARYIDWDDA